MLRLLIALAATGLLASSAAHAKRLKITGVTASSEYDEDGTQYPARNVKDGKGTTAWYEGDQGNGLGAWVEVDLGGEHDVRRIVVYGGDWKSEQDWKRANRPKELELKFSDDTTETWTLDDSYAAQSYAPSGGRKTSTIRFRLKSIHPGSAFPDTGISEIQVFDETPEAYVEVKAATASSEFAPDGNSYYATNTTDGLKDSYWCEGEKESDGVGQWLMYDFGGSKTVKTLEILNGMGTSFDLHKKGNVATKATLQFSDGSTKAVALKAFAMPQKVDLGSVTTSSVKITFDELRKGTEFDDLCVSEVYFLP
ncbi:MAG: hypothetical protein ACI9K2_000520 [Myxococcota bacterium]|jgi:hypothetical protein